MFPNKKIYFGITGNNYLERWGHNGKGYYGQYVFDKILYYGWSNIKHYILFRNLTKEEAEQKEIELIAKYKTNNKRYGYNIHEGGDLFKTVKVVCVNTSEIFNKIKDAEEKYNIDNASISKSCKDTEYKYSAGKHPETGEALIWQYYNEWLDNPKDHNKYVSEVERRSKKVICIETQKIYNNATCASNDTGIKKAYISDTCRGKQKSAGKLHWAYYNDYLEDPDKYIDLMNAKPKPNGNARKTLCIETNTEYPNATTAAKAMNVVSNAITRACRDNHRTCAGYHWKYIDE